MTLQKHLSEITKILLIIGERVEGNLFCDIEPTNVIHDFRKAENLRTLCYGKSKICEIGVNAGHSLLFMLDVNDKADYTLFDLGLHRYLEPCFSYLKSAFPNTNMNLIMGDSRSTLTKFAEEHKEEFDFCHIDGGHEADVFTSDYKNCMKMLKKGGVLIFDDTDCIEINNFVFEKVKNGELMYLTSPALHPIGTHALLVKI